MNLDEPLVAHIVCQILCRKEINYHSMQEKEKEQLYSEFSILHSLKHPNIVGYYHRDHLRNSQDLHLYMEYCSGGDLGKIIKQLRAKKEYATEDYVWNIFSQIITALYRCHYGVDPPMPDENGAIKPPGLRLKNQVMILHRDLKPENSKVPQFSNAIRAELIPVKVFLGEGHSVKLGDFGLSKVMQSHDFASTYVGTPYYMSPEICASERYTLHSDIWALGCIMYELCTTRVPFNAATHIQLIQKINSGKIDPIPAQYSQELNEVIRSCLKINPHHRPDTAILINHGKVRLAREKREVVTLGKELEKNEKELAFKLQQLSLKEANWEKENEKWKARVRAEISVEVEETKRREWEVRASLEITKQIQIQMANLQAKFETEVQARVEAEIQKRTKAVEPSRPISPPSTRASSFAQDVVDDPSTSDPSNLTPDSPIQEQPSLLQFKRITPPKRKIRGPLARSRTQFDSPMDVTMGEPSPVSIANLNLSPRRTAAADLPSIHNGKNIFAAAAGQGGSATSQLPTPPSLDHSTIEEVEDEDGLPELPSPTRAPTATSDRFKAARPGLLRQKTAPMGRLPAQPALFPTSRAPRVSSPPNAARSNLTSTTATGSPTRKKPDDMFRKVMARNIHGPIKPVAEIDPAGHPASGSNENVLMKKVMHRNLRGQTLVELAQPRAGGSAEGVSAKGSSGGENNWRPRPDEIVVWDPEVDDMPSPFLQRSRKKT